MATPTNTSRPSEPGVAYCPRCKQELKRINRTWYDKLLNKLVYVRRYRCMGCLWEGVKFSLDDPDKRE